MKRTMLFTPANNAANVINADAMGADRIVLDLEDAVSPHEKDAARVLAKYALRHMNYSREVVVRINSTQTPFWKDDIAEIVPAKPDFLMTPKINDEDEIRQLDACIADAEKGHGIQVGDTKIIAIIETAGGIENAYRIAKASPRMSALFLGAADLANDVHSTRTPVGEEIAYARNRLIIAARAAKIDAFDTPYMYINDLEGAKKDAELAKQLGFDGKASIHPSHVDLFNEIFSPGPAEIERAYGILEALEEGERQGKGVVTYNGEMIDAPIAYRARQVVNMVDEMRGRI